MKYENDPNLPRNCAVDSNNALLSHLLLQSTKGTSDSSNAFNPVPNYSSRASSEVQSRPSNSILTGPAMQPNRIRNQVLATRDEAQADQLCEWCFSKVRPNSVSQVTVNGTQHTNNLSTLSATGAVTFCSNNCAHQFRIANRYDSICQCRISTNCTI